MTGPESNEGRKSKKLPKPEVEIIVDGNAVHKPGMKTFYMDQYSYSKDAGDVHGSEGIVVGGTVCTCDKVSSGTGKPGSCPSYSPGSAGGGTCTCNKVCTCIPVT